MTWKGGFYVEHPERGPWELRMELQSHEPTNAIFLNGHFLSYLPMKDWTYSWVSASFSVPSEFLQPGCNELTVQAGYVAPQLQGTGFTWDDVLFRDILLE
ncbi:MAG: hypothetical protein P8186_02235 [Anaerolineae bacterium]